MADSTHHASRMLWMGMGVFQVKERDVTQQTKQGRGMTWQRK